MLFSFCLKDFSFPCCFLFALRIFLLQKKNAYSINLLYLPALTSPNGIPIAFSRRQAQDARNQQQSAPRACLAACPKSRGCSPPAVCAIKIPRTGNQRTQNTNNRTQAHPQPSHPGIKPMRKKRPAQNN